MELQRVRCSIEGVAEAMLADAVVTDDTVRALVDSHR
jgi:hypothetical protein